MARIERWIDGTVAIPAGQTENCNTRLTGYDACADFAITRSDGKQISFTQQEHDEW